MGAFKGNLGVWFQALEGLSHSELEGYIRYLGKNLPKEIKLDSLGNLPQEEQEKLWVKLKKHIQALPKRRFAPQETVAILMGIFLLDKEEGEAQAAGIALAYWLQLFNKERTYE